MAAATADSEKLSLEKEMDLILGEARTVLPGIQALFGFQTVGVFNERFTELPDGAVLAYLLALGLLVLAGGLVMTPAAYHRLVEPDAISRRTIDVSSHVLTAALLPLLLALSADVGIVLAMATDALPLAIGCGIATAVVLSLAWFVLPWRSRRVRRARALP